MDKNTNGIYGRNGFDSDGTRINDEHTGTCDPASMRFNRDFGRKIGITFDKDNIPERRIPSNYMPMDYLASQIEMNS